MSYTPGEEYTRRFIRIYCAFFIGTLIGLVPVHIIKCDIGSARWWLGWLMLPIVALVSIFAQLYFVPNSLVNITHNDRAMPLDAIVIDAMVNLGLPFLFCCCGIAYFCSGRNILCWFIAIIAAFLLAYNYLVEPQYMLD